MSGSSSDNLLVKYNILPVPKIIPKIDPDPDNKDKYHRKDIQVNNYLASVYETELIENNNKQFVKFIDKTNPIEGRHLYNLIYENNYTNTLEIGLAMGASAAWICQAHKDLEIEENKNNEENKIKHIHYAIDPNQTGQYDNLGLTLLKRAGLKNYLKLIEKPSYRALPILLEKVLSKKIPRFQLIYIDGWHTFDYTLIDFFYADLLLDIHGIIVIDDIRHKSVAKAIKYITTNYKNYRLVNETPCYKYGDWKLSTQATFIKLYPDQRSWNYHVDF